jgi:hypothetical protein
LYKNKNDGKWVALDNGKRVVEKILHDKQWLVNAYLCELCNN